jgi:hypothetical protein
VLYSKVFAALICLLDILVLDYLIFIVNILSSFYSKAVYHANHYSLKSIHFNVEKQIAKMIIAKRKPKISVIKLDLSKAFYLFQIFACENVSFE